MPLTSTASAGVEPAHERLLHENAIRNLCAAYSHAVARLDAAAAAAVYAEDGVLSAFSFPELVGRKAIASALEQTLAPLAFLVQTCSAGVIDVRGDEARASWSVSEWFQYRDSDGLGRCFGMYEDRLVRQAGGWRFAYRRFHPFYRSVDAGGGKRYAPPAAFINDYSPWPSMGQGDGGQAA
jgi:ketosteroid isomerase-like protein